MNATDTAAIQSRHRELTPEKHREVLETLREISQPYVQAKLRLLSCCTPIIEQTRTEDGWVLSSSYSPDVQAKLDEIDHYFQQEVDSYLRQQGLRV